MLTLRRQAVTKGGKAATAPEKTLCYLAVTVMN